MSTDVCVVAKTEATEAETSSEICTSSRNLAATSFSASAGHSENQLIVVHETSAGNMRT